MSLAKRLALWLCAVFLAASPALSLTQGQKAAIFAGRSFPILSLPAGASAIYSIRRVSGWSGKAARVFRPSNSAQADVGFVGNEIDIPGAVAFNGSSPVIVSKWYDQSGNGNDAANATLTIAANPIVRSASPGIVFDGDKVFSTRAPLLTLPTTISLLRTGFSVFMAVKPSAAMGQNQAAFTPIGGNPVIEFSTSQAGSTRLSMQADANNGLVVYWANSTLIGTNKAPLPGVPTVIGVVANGSSTVIYNDGKTSTGGAMSASTMLGGELGLISAAAGFIGRHEIYAVVIYPRALSSTDVAAVKTAFSSAFATDASFTDQLIFCGDSITDASQAAELQTIERQVQQKIPNTSIKVYNQGMGGAQWADTASLYTTFTAPLYSSSFNKNIILVNTGVNDFLASSTALSVETAVSNFSTTARSAGFKVLVATVLGNTHGTLPQNTQQAAYNVWLRANWASIADGLVDYDNDPVMGSAAGGSTNTSLYSDGLHPTALGYSYLLNEAIPAIMGLL